MDLKSLQSTTLAIVMPCGHRDSERDRKRHHDPQLGPDGGRLFQAEAWESKPGTPPLGIGRHCRIEGAIIDKNACIGDGW